MEVTLEFCGGAEQAHNKGEKYYTLKVDQGPGQEVTLRDIFIMIRHNQVISTKFCKFSLSFRWLTMWTI